MFDTVLPIRPIPTGWAFCLPIILLVITAGLLPAQQGEMSHASGHETAHDHGATHIQAPGPHWEGSVAGIAYSEFNHHLAGILILVIGLTELWGALGIGMLAWSRFILPLAMFGMGAYLMIWSDHDAWPIGSRSFSQTVFGGDWEMLQHKIYALLAVSVGAIEGLRWVDHRLRHALWAVPFPAFAVVGGLMLFLHDHGVHPSAHKIALDHAIMGTLAVAAGFCKLVSARSMTMNPSARPARWDLAWAGCIVLIGLQLLFYSE